MTIIRRSLPLTLTVSDHLHIENSAHCCIASTLTPQQNDSTTKNGTPPKPASEGTNQLELLLSLDVALELIHADREALKRVETFAGYPGHYGHRVRDTIEELFILMLQTLGERHVTKGFGQ